MARKADGSPPSAVSQVHLWTGSISNRSLLGTPDFDPIVARSDRTLFSERPLTLLFPYHTWMKLRTRSIVRTGPPDV